MDRQVIKRNANHQFRCIPTYLVATVFVIFLGLSTALANQKTVKIGVLAHRGGDVALRMWTPTAIYLTEKIPGVTFTIVPLGLADTRTSGK